MQYHLAFLVLTVCCLSVTAQSGNNSTVEPVVHNVTVPETTFAPTTKFTEHITATSTAKSTTAVPLNVNSTTTFVSNATSTTTVLNKSFQNSYVEPPPHPRGYCIRTPIRCSKIRRCCNGPCDVSRMRCP